MKNIKTLADLAIDHPYYCSDSNYYKTNTKYYNSWEDFYNTMKNYDIDLNLIFRWDIIKYKSEMEMGWCPDGIDIKTDYYLQLSFMLQRKGIYMPKFIYNLTEKDVPQIIEYLTQHYEKMKELWNPFTL